MLSATINSWKVLAVTVVITVNVSCQQIVDSISSATNLLSPPIFLQHNQQHHNHQFQYKHEHNAPSDGMENNDDATTESYATNLLLLNLQKQLLDAGFDDNVADQQTQLQADNKNNQTIKVKENILKKILFSSSIGARVPRDNFINNYKPFNRNEQINIDDSIKYYDSEESSANSDLDEVIDVDDTFDENKRSALRSARMSRRSQQKQREVNGENFVSSSSVGAMSKLNDFFDQLNTNIKTVEITPNFHHLSYDEVAYLENQIANNKKEYINDYYAKPSGSAAFLHAIRSYRPSQKIRALVAMQPESYRGANFHDPNFLWQGLGK